MCILKKYIFCINTYGMSNDCITDRWLEIGIWWVHIIYIYIHIIAYIYIYRYRYDSRCIEECGTHGHTRNYQLPIFWLGEWWSANEMISYLLDTYLLFLVSSGSGWTLFPGWLHGMPIPLGFQASLDVTFADRNTIWTYFELQSCQRKSTATLLPLKPHSNAISSALPIPSQTYPSVTKRGNTKFLPNISSKCSIIFIDGDLYERIIYRFIDWDMSVPSIRNQPSPTC